jgi:hypothetical protein
MMFGGYHMKKPKENCGALKKKENPSQWTFFFFKCFRNNG